MSKFKPGDKVRVTRTTSAFFNQVLTVVEDDGWVREVRGFDFAVKADDDEWGFDDTEVELVERAQ